MTKNKVTVITAKSESGDDYGPWVFESNPTEQQLIDFLKKEVDNDDFPGDIDENADGPGDFGSYLHLNISNTEIIKIII